MRNEFKMGTNKKNLKLARKYYQQAAYLGDKDGMESYARFLEQGIGGEKRPDEARKYRDLLEKT